MVINHRKPNRLKNFNYSSTGYYFVTICTEKRQEYFGNVFNNEMALNEYGRIINKFWLEIPKHFNNVELDEFQIMPNHIHLIIIINYVGTIHELSLQNNNNYGHWLKRRNMLICKIIGFFKMNSSKRIHQLGLNVFRWQRSFYDHIIRTEYSLFRIRQYIKNNPLNWNNDRNNLINK